MNVNYHTHTYLCGHAIGGVREYVEAAIGAGFKRLGFADHSPQFFDGGYGEGIRKNMRMTPFEAEGYISEIRALSEEYKNDIELFVGFEAEYFPSIFGRLQSFCRDFGVDYLILGQHCLTIEPSEYWIGAPTAENRLLTLYVDQVLEGLNTGSFTYLCHPDMCNFVGDEEHYVKEMTRLCKGAKSLNIPIEMNLQGLREGRFYPTKRFISIAAEIGNQYILGADAHSPDALGLTVRDGVPMADKIAKEFGFEYLKDISFKRI